MSEGLYRRDQTFADLQSMVGKRVRAYQTTSDGEIPAVGVLVGLTDDGGFTLDTESGREYFWPLLRAVEVD